MICPYCATPVTKENMRVCEVCGMPLPLRENTAQKMESRPKVQIQISKEKISNEVYDKCFPLITDGMDQEIVNSISKSYRDFVQASLDSYFNLPIESEDDLDKCVEIFIDSEQRFWKNKTTEQRMRILIPDDNLSKLKGLSSDAYKKAEKRVIEEEWLNKAFQPEITIEQAERYISEMHSLFEMVKTYNVNEAEEALSEGIRT